VTTRIISHQTAPAICNYRSWDGLSSEKEKLLSNRRNQVVPTEARVKGVGGTPLDFYVSPAGETLIFGSVSQGVLIDGQPLGPIVKIRKDGLVDRDFLSRIAPVVRSIVDKKSPDVCCRVILGLPDESVLLAIDGRVIRLNLDGTLNPDFKVSLKPHDLTMARVPRTDDVIVFDRDDASLRRLADGNRIDLSFRPDLGSAKIYPLEVIHFFENGNILLIGNKNNGPRKESSGIAVLLNRTGKIVSRYPFDRPEMGFDHIAPLSGDRILRIGRGGQSSAAPPPFRFSIMDSSGHMTPVLDGPWKECSPIEIYGARESPRGLILFGEFKDCYTEFRDAHRKSGQKGLVQFSQDMRFDHEFRSNFARLSEQLPGMDDAFDLPTGDFSSLTDGRFYLVANSGVLEFEPDGRWVRTFGHIQNFLGIKDGRGGKILLQSNNNPGGYLIRFSADGAVDGSFPRLN